MKRKQHPVTPAKDTPAIRKRRLQQRLQEISEKSERELAALMKSINKVKSSFRPKKS
ncbi:MAG TPA: hypothetical protein VLE99_00340 [Candidatus Saccharimonadales bacterium]|nr:hypothetical protein [Candidatus Saccharimonadales bacterium]